MNAQITTYLNWLRERGLESFDPIEIQISETQVEQAPVTEEEPQPTPSASVDIYIGDAPTVLICLHNKSSSLKNMDKEQKLLLANLLKAIKLSFAKVVLVSVTEPETMQLPSEIFELAGRYNLKRVLMMGTAFSEQLTECTFGQLSKLGDLDVLTTHSVFELHSDASLKRAAWGHLQNL